MNSEMLGLSYLQIALGKTDHLVAHINSNDKEPSWDGDVEVYRKAGHVHAKCCTYEEEVFSHFMKTLFIPYIKSKYNEVNQNERKAENRCT